MLDIAITIAWIVLKILVIVLPIMGIVAYATMAERKVIGYIQTRVGPNRVGIRGLGQPIADALKLLFKEMIIPTASNRYLFLLAPIMTLAPALAAWAVIPFSSGLVLADVDGGVLFVFAMTSLAVYGILIAGWASNSKYSLLGALRSAAQVVSYEIAMGFSFVGVLIAAGSTNLSKIVLAQSGGLLHWYWLPLLPLFAVYWISGVAETNRAPFDLAEGESEIVAGFHVEYSGMMFALFFLAEYANMVLIAALTVLFFFGGWLSPFEGIPGLQTMFAWVPGLAWFFVKTCFFIYAYFWLRATFPRFRYDQVMRLGWKVLIPITLVWITVVGIAAVLKLGPWFS